MQVIAGYAGRPVSVVRPRYTDEFRASCVVMLDAAGYPDVDGALAQVSRRVHVAQATLHRWYHGEQNPPPSRLVTTIKRDLAEMLQQAAELHAERISDPTLAERTSARDSAVVMGIAVDKLRLLQDMGNEHMAAARAYFAAASAAGVDGMDMLARLTDRLNAQAANREEVSGGMVVRDVPR